MCTFFLRLNHMTFFNKNNLCLNKIFTVLCSPWPYYLSLTSKLPNVFGSPSHLPNFLSLIKNHFIRIDSEATCPSLELTNSEGVQGTESHGERGGNYLIRALYVEYVPNRDIKMCHILELFHLRAAGNANCSKGLLLNMTPAKLLSLNHWR